MSNRGRLLWEHERDLRDAWGRLESALDNPHATLTTLTALTQKVCNEAKTYRDRLDTASPIERKAGHVAEVRRLWPIRRTG